MNPAFNIKGHATTKPFLKWAGGKTQLLPQIRSCMPDNYNKYIEPFIGGGALFFSLNPKSGIISDLNPELVNVYQRVKDDVEQVIMYLSTFKNSKEDFYEIRSMRFEGLQSTYAAARTIYLNRTCFNGLYRVNKSGHFNVPYGNNRTANIIRSDTLRAASKALQDTKIICGDYKSVLQEMAEPGDFVFLDPPYLPATEYADFKRYTKEQFYEEDHRELADEVRRLQKLGCHVVLTNSNHPLVHELYDEFNVKVHNTRRNISSKSSTRKGEDTVVTIEPLPRFQIREVPKPANDQAKAFPSTRYMGSKEKLLPYIQHVARKLDFETATDLFSGTGVVGYMFKSLGKQVNSNDYMAMGATFAKAMIENNTVLLTAKEIDGLFKNNANSDGFVQTTFEGLYYTNDENVLIDQVRANLKTIGNPYKQAIALSALMRACMKKRARGIFTYTGLRYDDGRADLVMTMEEQIRNAAELINNAVFDNGYKNKARQGDAMTSRLKADLVYIDPPYYSPLSDNEYVRRYHFIEGLACDWRGVDMQWHTKTKKFKSYPTPFSSLVGATDAFDKLFKRLRDSKILVSYSSNSSPSREEIISLLAKYKKNVEVLDIDYRYSFANQKSKIDDNRNEVKEYLFVGY